MTAEDRRLRDLIAPALADLDFARDSHLKWAEHLEAHAASGVPCPECEGKPYKLDAEHEREWVAKYDRLIAIVRRAEALLSPEGTTPDEETPEDTRQSSSSMAPGDRISAIPPTVACQGDSHGWGDGADAEGDTCDCGEWYRFADRIERTPQ